MAWKPWATWIAWYKGKYASESSATLACDHSASAFRLRCGKLERVSLLHTRSDFGVIAMARSDGKRSASKMAEKMVEAASKDIPEAVPAENRLKQMNAAATASDAPLSVRVSHVAPPTLLVCGFDCLLD